MLTEILIHTYLCLIPQTNNKWHELDSQNVKCKPEDIFCFNKSILSLKLAIILEGLEVKSKLNSDRIEYIP